MAAYIVALEELRKKAFEEDLFLNIRHPEGTTTISELTRTLLEEDLRPELERDLKEFLAFVEEVQELSRLEFKLLEENESLEEKLKTSEEILEMDELKIRLSNIQHELERLEKDRSEQRQECRRMRRDPPF
ncbi:hypothetical protein [Bradyrhizobium sp. TM233]|uniref:hypothetical protein n=1 Tax=Bradyrhizobium sp. TM233 TaxID=2599801 RepID=UPI0027D53DF2|nr:hypothetical protein TM233_66980 [Bradyrhizobium sp. TM233]